MKQKGLGMNRITKKIYDGLNNNGYMKRIILKRETTNNTKDFEVQVGYIIMDMVNREKQFFDIDRSEIDIARIAQELF